MKAKQIIFGMLFFLFAFTFSLEAKEQKLSKQEKAELLEALLEERINKGDFRIYIDQIMTGRGAKIVSNYSVIVSDNKLISALPYVGRGTGNPGMVGNYLNFTAPLQSYTLEAGKKGTIIVNMTANANGASYTYKITVHPNGTCYLKVDCNKLDPVNYAGKMTPLTPAEIATQYL